jgi:hypothetical protein
MARYPVLGLVKVLLAIAGWLAIAIAALLLFSGFEDMGRSSGRMDLMMQGWLKVSSSVALLLGGLLAVGLSELLTVFVAIEVNTRRTIGPAATPTSASPGSMGVQAQRTTTMGGLGLHGLRKRQYSGQERLVLVAIVVVILYALIQVLRAVL